MSNYILSMESITKDFVGVKALDDVSIDVREGSIHCICGENGAGKSTLMKVLSGVHPSGTYSGKILLYGKEQHFKNIADSEKSGIAIIYQELALVPDMTIAENIFLGHEYTKGYAIDFERQRKEAKEILKKVGLNISADTTPRELGVGQQQLVEIAKALTKKVKLLVLDEPTASLNDEDSDNLLTLIKELKGRGITSIMISHKLKEILVIADAITVIRDGRSICELGNTATEAEIITNMVGRSIDNVFPKRKQKNIGEIILEVENISAYNKRTGRTVVSDASFDVRKGEVVGIAGLMGAGRTELAHCIFGNPKKYSVTGRVKKNGKKIKLKLTSDAIRNGIAYVTEDRKGDGLILIQNIRKNITLSNLDDIKKGLSLDVHKEITVSRKYLNEINIKAQSVEQIVKSLSGGNQQKVSISKWLYTKPDILILDEPTRGIDVGAKFEIYTIMNELVEAGMSIIMISSELSEIIGMSDRIYVLSDGTIKKELDISEATQENIMKAAIS